jgi:hypothetical protein
VVCVGKIGVVGTLWEVEERTVGVMGRWRKVRCEGRCVEGDVVEGDVVEGDVVEGDVVVKNDVVGG